MNNLQIFIIHRKFKLVDEAKYQLAQGLVDPEARQRASRFFHREDSWRFLVGRLMRHLIISRLVEEKYKTPSGLDFRETKSGKPYLHSPTTMPPIGFNISHDHDVVSLAIRRTVDISIARNIGIDIMLAQLPEGETFSSFVESISIGLTRNETEYLVSRSQDPVSIQEAVVALFQIWTVKEAYVKALGSGLGFDLCRLEYIPQTNNGLLVDGSPLTRWRLDTFRFSGISSSDSEEQVQEYIGAVCYQLSEEELRPKSTPPIVAQDTNSFPLQQMDLFEVLREVQTLMHSGTNH